MRTNQAKAKANKHAKLTQYKPVVNGSDDTKKKTVGYGEIDFGNGRYGGPPQLIVTDVNGGDRYLEDSVGASVKFLDDLAENLGLLPSGTQQGSF